MSFSRPNCAIPCDVRIPSATRVLETQNLLLSSQVLPPKREAFHKRGGFCTGPSECLNCLVSSETMEGLRPRLARRPNIFSVALLTLLAVFPSLATHATTWERVWSDEFDGPGINSGNWTYDIGGGGWGNKELEYYTDRAENSYIIPDPNDSNNHWLVIEARQEKFRNRNYTSARLKTQGLKNWTYGRMDARINIPAGQGVWPAFWLLGSNFPDVGWPACGEIDVMEHVLPIGPNTIRGSAHGPNYSGADSVHGDAILNTGYYAGSGE